MRFAAIRPDVLLDTLAGWPRKAAAGFCLIAAVVSLFHSNGSAGALTSVVVAARPIDAGATLATADLRLARWPTAAVPAGAFSQLSGALGSRLATPLARGEPIGPSTLLTPAIARALARGLVATTVTLSSPDQASILRTGSTIDLYASASDGVLVEGSTVTGNDPGQPLAEDVEVLAVLPAAAGQSIAAGPGLVVAARPATAARLATHVSGTFLATLVQPP